VVGVDTLLDLLDGENLLEGVLCVLLKSSYTHAAGPAERDCFRAIPLGFGHVGEVFVQNSGGDDLVDIVALVDQVM
jgi:hypothetical protein